jgi:hypothetical protein
LEQFNEADDVCDIIQAHKHFCGCPEALNSPLNNCFLCADGSNPTNLSAETPFEDNCSELDTYLRYLPEDLCATERAEAIRRTDVYCGCAGATVDCYMCDDETNNLDNPDSLVPFFSFLRDSFSATCRELAAFYTVYNTNDEISICDFVKLESRYCGCQSEADASPVGACKLCPDGAAPALGSKVIDELEMTCDELETYLSYVAADQCSMPWITDLQRFDYFCGCAAATAECPMCLDQSVDLTNPDAIIPYLIIPRNENPTCQQLATLGVIAAPGELVIEDCYIFSSQAAFCGCPNTTKPTTGCQFCPNGTTPSNPDLVTPFGDTCSELSEYLTFLSPDECSSQRVGFIQRQDFLCGCSKATTDCAFCSEDGSNEVSQPGRHIPLLSLPLNSNPICKEVVEFLAINDGVLSDEGCSALQSYRGYCGCPAVAAVNQCSFCPNGGNPATPDKIVAELFTCQDLHDFVSFLTAENCQPENADFTEIQAFAYTCGCPNTQPGCTLCPGGVTPLQADKLLSDGETSCAEFADLVTTLTPDQCNQQASTLDDARIQCGCRGGDNGELCAVQVNANLCTIELLDSVTEQCTCYAFCDSTFVKCQSIEGGLLAESQCSGTAITGCSRSGAIAGGGSSSGNGSSAYAVDGSSGDDKTLIIALAVAIPAAIALLVTIYYFFTRKSSASNDKMAANFEAEQEIDAPYSMGEVSMSMSDVPMSPPSPPAPPPSSFSSMDSSRIDADVESKVV